jgi:putative flippase GtrA
MKGLLRQVSGYGVASAAALTLDMAIFWWLVHVGVYYIVAASVSFISGSFVAYFLSIHLAFHQHRLADRRLEFISFFAIGLAALLINVAVIAGAVQLLRVHYMLARCIAAGCTFTFNFVVRRQLLFVTARTS